LNSPFFTSTFIFPSRPHRHPAPSFAFTTLFSQTTSVPMFTQVFAAAFIALTSLAQSVLAKTTGACDRTYTIQEGDICDSISASHNVSTYQLAAINSGIIDSTCSNLVVGNSICLGYDGEDCSTTYVVAGGDNCDLITSKFGINGTILSLNNPQINKACDNIYVGEVLCTSQTVQVPPAPAGPPPAASIPATATAASPTASAHDDEDLPFCDDL
jgi:LysM repeat protein